MSYLLEQAIQAVIQYPTAFCKFIAANDAGVTGSHQSGIYIPHNAYRILFDEPGVKGNNKDRFVKIKWQADYLC